MSLDVYLELDGPASVHIGSGSGIFIRENGSTREITRAEWDERFPDAEPVISMAGGDAEDRSVYSANITHNLNKMADAAGIYKALWRPGEIGITKAGQLTPLLETGLTILKADPERFKQFNPENGWGSYEGLVRFTEQYLEACKENPDAAVRVSR